MCHYWNLLHSFMTNGGLFFFFLPFPELSLINESTANHHVKVICLKKRPYFPHPSRTPAGRTFGAIVTVLFTCVFNFLCCSDFIQSSHETHTTSKVKSIYFTTNTRKNSTGNYLSWDRDNKKAVFLIVKKNVSTCRAVLSF